MKILILHPGALGDLILSLPALMLLRREYPASHLTLCGNLDYLAVCAPGYADQVISLSSLPLHHLFNTQSLPLPEIAFWQSFDRIVSWFGAHDDNLARKLRSANPNLLMSDWKPAAGERRHVSRIFVDSLSPWFQPPAGCWPAPIRLQPTAESECVLWLREQRCEMKGPVIAVHPGAGGAVKRWPLDRFRQLVLDLLSRREGQMLILEGPAEQGIGEELAALLPGSRVHVAPSLALPVLAALLSKCSLFVGNDSGIAHLAAGLGIPSIVLFGPTAPEHWVPLGAKVVVLRNNSSCRACHHHGLSPHTCMQGISVEAVLSRCKELI